VVNAQAGSVDVFSLAAPSAPTFDSTLDVAADVAANVATVASADDLGAANSVAVDSASDTLAVAIEADHAPQVAATDRQPGAQQRRQGGLGPPGGDRQSGERRLVEHA